jgi:hypothetical protein
MSLMTKKKVEGYAAELLVDGKIIFLGSYSFDHDLPDPYVSSREKRRLTELFGHELGLGSRVIAVHANGDAEGIVYDLQTGTAEKATAEQVASVYRVSK